MSYDVRPLDTLKEKASFLERAFHENYLICFEHDPVVEFGRIGQNERGRYYLQEALTLEDVRKI